MNGIRSTHSETKPMLLALRIQIAKTLLAAKTYSLKARIRQIVVCARAVVPMVRSGRTSRESMQLQTAIKHSRRLQKSNACCALREHASTLLRKRLISNGFDEHVAFEAVQRAIDCGLVCDERYADVLVRSRLSQGKGLRGIAFELEQADIDPCSVPAYQDALSNENGPDELTRALRLLDAKPPKAKRTREAAYRKLVQKGYTSSVAASAARIFEERCRCDALSAH